MMASGISKETALKTLYVVDIDGLVHTGLANIPPHQRPFARTLDGVKNSHISLLETIEKVRPTALIGVSAQHGVFNEQVVTTMARYTERPIIFPLSNPTAKSEAHPTDLLTWTKNKAIVATGSPFPDVPVSQCNNVYVFPGVGLGVVASGAREVTDRMFYRAAEILSHHSPMLKSPSGSLFPPFEALREITREIALGVIEVAQEEGVAPKKTTDLAMWSPHYN
jgi:malate dehydrogenase (oxaloacetate-decarboxylating)